MCVSSMSCKGSGVPKEYNGKILVWVKDEGGESGTLVVRQDVTTLKQ